MITHTNAEREYLIVEVSEGITGWRIHELQSVWLLTYGNGNDYIKLPPCNYSIIGKADHLINEWGNIVEKDKLEFLGQYYKNYIMPNIPFLSPIASGLTLLRSHSLNPQTTLILQKI